MHDRTADHLSSEPLLAPPAITQQASASTNRRARPTPSRRQVRWRLWLTLAGLAGVGLAIPMALAEPSPLRRWLPRTDWDRWHGQWRLYRDGQPLPVAVRVSDDVWEYVGENGSRAYRLSLDWSQRPHRLELELLDAGQLVGPTPRLHGIYEFDGRNQVRVCICPQQEPLPQSWEQAAVVLTFQRD